MTDKEKAKEYAIQHSCPAINDGCIAIYKGVLVGLAEGRKEIEELKDKIKKIQEFRKIDQKQILDQMDEISELKKENEQLKQSKNALTIQYEQDIAELKAQNKDLCESLDIMNNRESELLDQIEKMKCCGNCGKIRSECIAEEQQGILCGKNKNKWILAE